jgi:hypothetical protein
MSTVTPSARPIADAIQRRLREIARGPVKWSLIIDSAWTGTGGPNPRRGS